MVTKERVIPYPIGERQEQLATLAGVVLERSGIEEEFGTDYYSLTTNWLPNALGREVKVVFSSFDADTARVDVITHVPGTVGVETNTVAFTNRNNEKMLVQPLFDGIENLTGFLASALVLQTTEKVEA